MTFSLRDWPRALFEPDAVGEPFLLFYVYGEFKELPSLEADKYRSMGVPAGIEVQMYNRRQHVEAMDSFLGGIFGEFLDKKEDIAGPVRQAPHLIVVKGTPADYSNLNYLRDCIGLLMYLIDCGGVCVLDPQTLSWWSPLEWKEQFFDAKELQPTRHVAVLGSPEEGAPERLWLHTRGLRKFGRPDISLHNVEEKQRESALQLVQALVNTQVLGGILEDGKEIDIDGFPAVRCYQRGSEDDPDFYNKHVAVEWTTGSAS